MLEQALERDNKGLLPLNFKYTDSAEIKLWLSFYFTLRKCVAANKALNTAISNSI